jgi:hypothetical protein
MREHLLEGELGIINVYVRDKFAESTMLAPIAVPK